MNIQTGSAPKVTVVIPTWNRATLLQGAIESVLSQTEKSFELLVCDDGSTDESKTLVNSFADSRVRWIEGKRSGRPAPARNRGIREARGAWIAFLDSDDAWVPEKIELQLGLAEQFGLKSVASNAFRLNPESGLFEGKLIEYKSDRISLSDLASTNWVICSSMMFHSSLVKDVIGFPEEPLYRAIEDYALWMRVATFTDIGFIDKPLVIYRDDAASSIRADETLKPMSLRVRIFRNYLNWYKTKKGCRVNLRVLLKIKYLWLSSKVFCKVLRIAE